MAPRSITLILLLLSVSAFAAPRQNPGTILDAVKHFLSGEVAGSSGTVELQINAADLRLSLPECSQLEPFTPPGARLLGSTTVGVRCIGDLPWTIYLPVQIVVTGYYLAAAHPLEPGQTLSRDDLVVKEGDLTQLPSGILSVPAQAIGKVIVSKLADGEPLCMEMMQKLSIAQKPQPLKIALREP